MKAWKQTIQKMMPALFAFVKGLTLLYQSNSYLVTSGLMHTYRRGHPCKPDGSPLPWMNYNVIALLEARLRPEMALFEFGSGFSTLFYARLVGRVVSVEHNQAWFGRVSEMVGPNVRLIHQPLDSSGNYPRQANLTGETYDVIIIDGRERVACAKNAWEALTPVGVILFDDTTRPEYREGCDFLQTKGMKRLDFEGIQPTGFELQRTSIFYRTGNCLDI